MDGGCLVLLFGSLVRRMLAQWEIKVSLCKV